MSKDADLPKHELPKDDDLPKLEMPENDDFSKHEMSVINDSSKHEMSESTGLSKHEMPEDDDFSKHEMSEKDDFSALEMLPEIPFQNIVKMSQADELKSLRETSKTLRDRVERAENRLFKRWTFFDAEKSINKLLEPEDLCRFSADVKTVKDLQLYVRTFQESPWLPSIQQLRRNHPELKHLRLRIHEVTNMEALIDLVPAVADILKELTLVVVQPSAGNGQFEQGSFPVLETLHCGGELSTVQTASMLTHARNTLKCLRLHQLQSIRENFIGQDCSFPVLEEVEISQCLSITGAGVVALLLAAARLKKLTLSYFNISGKEFKELERHAAPLRCLEVLQFNYGRRLKDLGLMLLIRCCPRLRVLNLSETFITGELFSQLRLPHVSQLEELHLKKCEKLTDTGLVEMIKAFGASLKRIDVSQTNINGESFAGADFDFVPKVEYLDVTACRAVTDKGLFSIYTKLGHELRILKACWVTRFSGDSFAQDLPFAVKLETLELGPFSSVKEHGAKTIFAKFGGSLKELRMNMAIFTGRTFADLAVARRQQPPPVLELLDLTVCFEIADDGLKLILDKYGSSLKSLKLGQTGITGESFQDVELPRLEELELAFCSKLTNAGLQAILNKVGKGLKKLNLRDTQVSEKMLAGIGEQCSALKELDLSNCKRISLNGLKKILYSFGRSDVLIIMADTAMSEEEYMNMDPIPS